jgi:hypothetical protein
MSVLRFLLQQALFIYPNVMNRLRFLIDADCVLYEAATKYLYKQIFGLFRLRFYSVNNSYSKLR